MTIKDMYIVVLLALPGVICAHQERAEAQVVVHLTQRDFDSGTVRIKTPGTLVILDEDVEFDPIPSAEATRTDKPLIGWFAAITVETDDVVIDLNGHSLAASLNFVDTQVFNVYANIELDNSPFAGILFGISGSNFIGDTEFVSANNVVIKNGTLGRSGHWGIHGNSNSGVKAHDLCIKDFEVASVELTGLINSTLHDIKISGLEHIIRNNLLKTSAVSYTIVLTGLAQMQVPGAAEQLASLLAYIEDNPVLFNEPRLNPTVNYYGMLFGSGFLLGVNFPVTPLDCEVAAVLSGGRTVENVSIENISVSSLTTAPEEVVLIGSRADGLIAWDLALTGPLPAIGSSMWNSAFDAEGNFAPTPFLLAQIFLINYQISIIPEILGILPPNYFDIVDSILTGNEEKFLENTYPIFGFTLDENLLKGAFGLRLDCAANCSIKNFKVKDVKNVGVPGKTLADIPAGQFYVGLLPETRYAGNDAWGFSFGTNDSVHVDSANSCGISSLNGDSFGLDLIGSDASMTVTNSKSLNITSFGDNTTSFVNPSTTSYGFRAQNNVGPLTFENCRADGVTAPRFALGFASESTDEVEFIDCDSEHISATSSENLTSLKEAFGFALEGAQNTKIARARIKNVLIKGEEGAQTSASVAAGISIDEESNNTLIIAPRIACVDGGAGRTFKIFNEGSNTIVKKCKKS